MLQVKSADNWFLALFMALISSIFGVAQAESAPIEKVVPPTMRSWPGIEYPNYTREARIELRYTVTSSGKVADIETIGGYYDERFQAAALFAFKKSVWVPGTVAGKSTDFFDQEIAIVFRLSQSKLTKPFLVALDEAVALIRDGKFADAKIEVEEMVAHKVKWLYEYVVLHAALSETFQKANQLVEAQSASVLSTQTWDGKRIDFEKIKTSPERLPDYYMLPQPMLTTALQRRFWLDVKLGYGEDALVAFNTLKALGVPLGDDFAITAENIKKRIGSSAPLIANGKLIDYGRFIYRASRHNFTVLDVSGGRLDTVEVTCTGAGSQSKRVIKFQEGLEWKLPATWKECLLSFRGEPETQFTLVELADDPKAITEP
jgi:hypothetical protein